MNNIKIAKTFSVILGLLTLFVAKSAYAFCPVCTIAVGGALILLEKFGVDNTITGLWIGALLLSFSFMTLVWLRDKKWGFPGDGPVVFVIVYVSTLLPLYWKNLIGAPGRNLWGMDKLLLGFLIGTVFFYVFYVLYLIIKKKNGGHAWFPFQKVIMPVFPLIVWTIIFYFITRGN